MAILCSIWRQTIQAEHASPIVLRSLILKGDRI
jgi:hypothetical protein